MLCSAECVRGEQANTDSWGKWSAEWSDHGTTRVHRLGGFFYTIVIVIEPSLAGQATSGGPWTLE